MNKKQWNIIFLGLKLIFIVNIITLGFKVYHEGMESWGISIILLTWGIILCDGFLSWKRKK